MKSRVVALCLMGLLLTAGSKATRTRKLFGSVEELGPIRVGGAAPDATLTSLASQRVELWSTKGKSSLLEFGPTWCISCRSMLRPLRELAQRSLNLRVVEIDVAEQAGSVREHYAAQDAGELQVLVDASGEVAERFGVHSFPTFVLVDRGGIVRMLHVGAVADLKAFAKQIEELAAP